MLIDKIVDQSSFFQIWAYSFVLGLTLIMTLSTATFYYYYWNPTYAKWKTKSSKEYPKPSKVREEIFQMTKGLVFSTIAPSLSLYLTRFGMTRGYYHNIMPWQIEVAAQIGFWVYLEFFEWLYHYGTHTTRLLWTFHKYHHTFPNPSPFAVIADEFIDQLVRSSPMLIYPLIFPLNIELMFFQMAILHYGYGTYLHCGHEFNYPDAHHPLLNTSYQHYCHHAISIAMKPIHCGFMLQIFDILAGSVHRECFCAKCCVKKGERTLEKWKELEKPDYSVMLSPSFWWNGFCAELDKLAKGTFIRVI